MCISITEVARTGELAVEGEEVLPPYYPIPHYGLHFNSYEFSVVRTSRETTRPQPSLLPIRLRQSLFLYLLRCCLIPFSIYIVTALAAELRIINSVDRTTPPGIAPTHASAVSMADLRKHFPLDYLLSILNRFVTNFACVGYVRCLL